MNKRVTTVAAATALAVTSLAAVPAAQAATVPAAAPVVQQAGFPSSPNHDESIRPIPVCAIWKLPNWLYQNFSDHGRDAAAGLSGGNFGSVLTNVIPYAFNDALFHLPATLTTLGGCLPSR